MADKILTLEIGTGSFSGTANLVVVDIASILLFKLDIHIVLGSNDWDILCIGQELIDCYSCPAFFPGR